jgi:long-chain acyl-CoA synthetase
MLSYENCIVSTRNGNLFDRLDENEEVIAYLPLAWVGDHLFSYAQHYVAGYCVNCPEAGETVVDDRREIGTTYAFAPPAVFENLLTVTMVRMEDAGRLKRAMFRYFIGHARKWGEKILNKEPVPLTARLVYRLGDMMVYGPLKNRFGLTDIRIGYTAGEAIGPEIFSFYRSIGVNLKQLYGQTEASVYITAQPDGEIYADTVGKPNIDVDVKIADNGEVLFKSPGVFQGYYKDPEKTAETKTPDGWVHTGDAGFFDPKTGHLKIIDRAKDVGRLRDGAMFAPKYIENKLKFYPNIKQAVALGNGRDDVTVMLNIDLTAVGSWAERNNVVYGSYQELAGHPRVYEMLGEHIAEVNKSLVDEAVMAGAQIKRFLVLHKELDADDGELTRTMKVRRGLIEDRYAALVKALYDGSKIADVATQVTFEDGRKGTLSARVAIRDATTYPVPEKAMEKAA